MAGTLITSAIALVLGVPVAVATALYINELCPRWLRTPMTILVELLAAVPSVVYGLWGVLVIIPALKPAEQWFSDTFSFLPFVGGPVAGPNYFIAGLILAIMILPIVSAISREVVATVPPDLKEASLALGATRWEMIRMAVLPYSRSGIVGASMLGLGRAIGETIAVTLVIGNAPDPGQAALRPGLHAGGGHRQRVRRGGQRQAALRRAHRRRPGPLRADPDHQRGRPQPGRAC